MTPRSRARSNTNRYGDPNSPVHQRGGGPPNAMRGGSQMGQHPPTINIVDSSGHPNQQMSHHNSYHENVNNYYDGGYHSNEQGRSYGGGSHPRYGGHTNEGRIANSSLPTSPCRKRNTRPLETSRGDGISTSTSNLPGTGGAANLPGGGGAGEFYWAAKVYITLVARYKNVIWS